jgi:hypothetical protein
LFGALTELQKMLYNFFHIAVIFRYKWGGTKVMPPIFLSENVTTITTTFTWMTHTSFAITKPFFQRVSVILNTVLQMFSKMLHTNVKFPALTSEHIASTIRNFKQSVTTHL